MRLLSILFNRLVNCSEIIVKTTENHSKHFSRNFSVGCQFYKNIPEWGSKKAHRNVKIQKQLIQEMADPEIEVKLAPLRAAVKEQVSLTKFRGYLEFLLRWHKKDDANYAGCCQFTF